MIASLPMYERPETIPATDRFWQSIRTQLAEREIVSPAALDRSSDISAAWFRSDLLLSQTCSLPFRTQLANRVRIIGTPDIKLGGCPSGHYCSVLLASVDDSRIRVEEFDGAVLGYNEETSQSGWAAPMADAEQRGIAYGGFRKTGSHENSAAAVANGIAEIAAVDAHSWRLIRQYCCCAPKLRVIGRTRHTPGLPLITAQCQLVEQLFDSVSAAIELAEAADLEVLPFRGLIRIPKEHYLRLPEAPSVPDC